MRHSIAGRSTVAGTTLRAVASVFAGASKSLRVREVGICNTTASAVAAALARFTNATGVGAGLTEANWENEAGAGTGFAGHTADGGVGQVFRQVSLGAAIASGFVWTFGDGGLLIPAGAANGIGVICPVGTGQILDYWIDWDE